MYMRSAFLRFGGLALVTGLGLVAAGACTSNAGGGRVPGNTNVNENLNENANANVNANDNTAANDNLAPNAAGLVEVPDPLSGDNPTYPLEAAAAPAPGASVADERLGTTQTRVVQAEQVRHEYARHDPFNVDQTLVLLLYLPDGQWRVYRSGTLPYDQDNQLVRTVELEEPRWDPANPDLLWGTQGFHILTVNVQTGETTLVKDFTQDATINALLAANPDVYRITMKDEGEASADQRYWAFILQGTEEDYRARFLFCWDRQEDAVLGTYTLRTNESRIDWVGMSPLGTWVVIGGDFDNGGDLGPGLVIANRAFTESHQLFPSTAHGDVGLDRQGREVFVQQNASEDTVDLIPLEVGGERLALLRLFYDSASPVGLNSGVHVSCNFPGFCVVSANIPPGMPEQNWLDRSIVLVSLEPDDPRVYYLAKVYGTTESYWEETQAAMSRDGTKVIWATNWNENVGEDRVWDVLLEMPADWVTRLGP